LHCPRLLNLHACPARENYLQIRMIARVQLMAGGAAPARLPVCLQIVAEQSLGKLHRLLQGLLLPPGQQPSVADSP
jgi:hypothetical protein